jgi:hypothetical protein
MRLALEPTAHGTTAPRARLFASVRASAARALLGALRASFGRAELDTGAARLVQADGDRLLGRARAVFALSNVVHFLAHELPCLGARRFACAFIFAGALNRPSFRHLRTSSRLGVTTRGEKANHA